MKIAQIHWAFTPVIGGVESHLAMLGPELVRNNCRVSLLTGSVPGLGVENYHRKMYIKRTPLMNLNILTPEKISDYEREIRQEIASFIEHVRPDLIHAHNMHYFSPVHADILNEIKQSRGIPLVLTAHNVWADDDLTWQEMNKRYHYWDSVIAVSNYIKNELVRVGYPENRVFVVHHGIDVNKFNSASEQDIQKIKVKFPEFKGRRIIFHPARMSLVKGCHIGIKALKMIDRYVPDVLLVLAGKENTVDWGLQQKKQVDEILNMVEELGLREKVFVSCFRWDEMPLLYKAAEFCIYPSCFEEPFGLVMLESMASEKTIIVSRAGGMPEVVQDGVNGFIVEMGDENHLAEKCNRLLTDRELCRLMGRQGRIMVEKYWTKETMANSTLAIYKNTLSGFYKIAN